MSDPASAPLHLSTASYPPLRAAAWLLALLFLSANLFNIDRLIVGVLAEQIRGEVHISEVQMSLLIGLAYSLLSGVFGIVLGFQLDRTVRVRLLIACLTLWSLATMAGGLTVGFGWLFAARALVGLGEAAMGPVAVSLIADLFAPGKRGRAIGVYMLGTTSGASLATIIPGLIVGANLHLSLPWLGQLSPWRTTFELCGLGGLVVAGLLLTAQEPVRQGAVAPVKLGVRAALGLNAKYLGAHAAIIANQFIGIGLFYTALVAITSWSAVFIERKFQVPLSQFSATLGAILLGTGVVGYLVAAWLIDTPWFRPMRNKLGFMAGVCLLTLPSACAVFAPSLFTAMLLLGLVTFTAPLINLFNSAACQDVLPNTMRGFGLSLCNATLTIFGYAAGPILVALATEHLFKQPRLIGYSILVVSVPALLAGATCFFMARLSVPRLAGKSPLLADVLGAAGAL
jgi:MFS family permease